MNPYIEFMLIDIQNRVHGTLQWRFTAYRAYRVSKVKINFHKNQPKTSVKILVTIGHQYNFGVYYTDLAYFSKAERYSTIYIMD